MSFGRIPDEVIETVLKRHDIVDVVGRYVHLTKQGRHLKGLCPFHSEKSPSFTVNPEKQFYHCFGCRAAGNLIHFVMEIEGYTFPEAVRQLAEEADLPIDWEGPSQEKTQDQKDREVLYDAHEFAAKLYHHVLTNTEQGKPALEYLLSRGLTHKWMEFFQIGCAPAHWDLLSRQLEKRGYSLALAEKGGLVSAKSDGGHVDKFRDRVIFPIHDFKGKVIAFAGRAMGDIQPKYLNSPESPLFNKSRNLFNFHRARPLIRKTGQAVLFEGYMDVIKAWEAGVENGIATMGTSFTDEHVSILRRNAEEVILCYDGDSAGQNAAYKTLGQLEPTGLKVKVAVLPEGKDPDEFIAAYGAERFRREIIEGAVSSVRFRLRYVRKNFNLQNEDSRLRYLETAARIIAELPSPLEREHYAKELSAEFSMGYDTFKQELNLARQDFLQKKENRDNKEKTWNTVRNSGSGTKKAASLSRAQRAEFQLLSIMMHDRDVAEQVRQEIGDQFENETHAALAAYLYAFYAQGNTPDASRYLAALQDDKLESAAGAILMSDAHLGYNAQVVQDCFREIRKSRMQADIKHKKEEMSRAERSGDAKKAIELASEIIVLEKRLKSC